MKEKKEKEKLDENFSLWIKLYYLVEDFFIFYYFSIVFMLVLNIIVRDFFDLFNYIGLRNLAYICFLFCLWFFVSYHLLFKYEKNFVIFLFILFGLLFICLSLCILILL